MNRKKGKVMFIIVAIVMGICMLLADIFFSNWRLLILACAGIIIAAFALIRINKKYLKEQNK